MKCRALALTALAAALMVSVGAIAKTPNNGPMVFANGSTAASPEGTPTLVVNVPVGGLTTNNLCGDFTSPPAAGNVTLNVTLGFGAVVTGLGMTGGLTTIGSSWRSEAAIMFRGSDLNQTVQFRPLFNLNSSGTGTFDTGVIDLTSNNPPLPNIDTGAAGVLGLELCETFDDGPGPDATFAPGTVVQVACFNCFDPFAAAPVAAPTLNQWGLIVLLGMMTLIGGLAVRRFS
jgi:hypothetical protein